MGKCTTDHAGFPMSYGRFMRSVDRYGKIRAVLHKAIEDGYIRRNPSAERPDNILVYRLANTDGTEPEGWYSENWESIADELSVNRRSFYAFCAAIQNAKNKRRQNHGNGI